MEVDLSHPATQLAERIFVRICVDAWKGEIWGDDSAKAMREAVAFSLATANAFYSEVAIRSS